MEQNPKCGGATGENYVDTDLPHVNESWACWFITHMQYYEYKLLVNYGKMFEGFNQFVLALPGCYSVYRYDAIKGEPLN